MRLSTSAALLLVFSTAAAAQAQFGDPVTPPPFGVPAAAPARQPVTQRWQIGVKVRAANGPCADLFGTAPVPMEWPEQQVKIIQEDVSPQVKQFRYRTLADGVKQMVFSIPKLEYLDSAHALVTFEITRLPQTGPEDPGRFVIPHDLPNDVRAHISDSPFIESDHPKITSLAKDLVKDKEQAWEAVETIYDWVQANVEYTNGDLEGALAALRSGKGDCEEMTSLFIALCRANKIPARMVWVPGHCYPEFFLHDVEGKGHWFPCQAAGTREFGTISEIRPILQKGDDFRIPEKKGKHRYVAELLKGDSLRGKKPEVQFIQQQVQ